LLAEAAIVAPRALSTGVPFASGTKTSGHDQPNHDLVLPRVNSARVHAATLRGRPE
jgi:hypothetical protein